MRGERVRAARRLVAQLTALALVVGLLAATEIWRSYDQTTKAAERSITGFVRLLKEQTERTVQAIDLTLIGMRDALQLAPSLQPDDAAYREALKQRLAGLPYVRALFVIGPDGFVIHDTDYPHTPRITLEDRLYFQMHRDNPELGLHIGPPLRSRSKGEWFVSVSRRINHPDGSFAGVVVAAVESRYLKRFYKDLSIGEGDTIVLLLKDGTLLARAPDHKEMIGKTVPLNFVRRSGSDTAWGASPIDGVRRVISYQVLASGALIVAATRSASAIYDSWIEHALVVGVGAILLWALAGGLVWRREEYRRQALLEQAHLAQLQRIETVGKIAGGVAHDLGNAVKVARTTLTLIKPSLTAQSDAMALVEEADRSLRGAFDIIDRLLAFARRQELAPTPTNLAGLISESLLILRQAAGPRIHIDLDTTGGEQLICVVDPIHLESALLNLVLNSKDAMADGRIIIQLREVQPPRRHGRMRGAAPATAPWAEIAVEDNGTGMTRDVIERAFEPFFTTRSGGSGLGLSQVLAFAQQCAGEVCINSEEGRGTTVRLLFPTIRDPA